MTDFTTEPIDPAAAATLEANGLSLELVDTADRARFEPWMLAVNRGFMGGVFEKDVLDAQLEGAAYRRTSGVYDSEAHDPSEPVGTVNSWPGRLTIPGERDIDAWAISSVTVAPTHRRRGIARALLEAELATANRLGIPIAMLTVSESTIYGRFGFAPAAMGADWTIDTHRVRWTGPPTSGRVQFVSIPEFRTEVAELHERTRLASPGMIDVWPRRWDQIAGIRDSDEARTKALRAARHVDDDGVTRGIVLYRVTGGDHDFVTHKVTVEKLVAETPDAYAALWRFLIEMDLVQEVSADLRATDEPLRWQLSDWRGATVKTYDHQWLRILDVVGAFTERAYVGEGRLALDVTDPLGYAEGKWLLTVEGDDPSVELVETIPRDVAALSMTANELAALYLGGVSAVNLAAARFVTESHPGDAILADSILRSPVTPWLSVWY